MEEITRNQETNQILIKDKLHFEDKLVYANSNGPQAKPHGMWARTEVIGGFCESTISVRKVHTDRYCMA